ncbi:hypothetical protein PHJA_000121900 [Phtheirospermum japonicum]|uniref:Uncharacterized protein n=1 Tax=Phtheirospermum japonicum TaxID=374723 RepID=A0A830B6R2_9LAMI|nr:hypothetical protein PHJA_000121900 [Phtheirospermum japonicum]
MESEANRRILAGNGRSKTPSAQYKLPFCDLRVYGSCIGADSKVYRRPCDYLNTCHRP